MRAFASALLLPMAVAMYAPSYADGPQDHFVDESGCVYSSQRAFRIPLDLPDEDRKIASKILLFVSQDEGKTWSRQGDHSADAKFVSYQAPTDGAYSFAIAVVTKAGQQIPPADEKLDAGLSVVVDSAVPELSVKPIRSKSNKQGVRWDVKDLAVESGSIAMAVFDSKSSQWSPVDCLASAKGEAWFDESKTISKIQMRIKDRAGNVAVKQVEINGDKFVKQNPDSIESVMAMSKAIAGDKVPTAVATHAKEDGAKLAIGSIGGDDELASPPQPLKVETAVASKSPAVGSLDDMEAPTSVVSMPNRKPIEPPTPTQTQAPAVESTGSVQHATFSPKREVAAQSRTVDDMRLIGAGPVLISYQVDAVEAIPTTKVELWGTLDAGRTWTKLAVDNDVSSPIEVKFTQGGKWGLMVCPYNEFTEDAAPKAGTAPEMVAHVDLTPPSIQIRGVKSVKGSLVFEWSATDERFGDKPISIFYSSNVNGPWQPIAVNVENNGEHAWPFLRNGARGQVFFRVEAKDAAGNSVVASTNKAFSLEIPKPKAKLVDIANKPGAIVK